MARAYSTTTQPKTTSETSALWLDIQHHPNGTIKKPAELENELRDPPAPTEPPRISDRVRGSLVGLALGDAVGAHVEFRPRNFLEKQPVHTLVGGGTWGLEKGQFTDDTSMALCLANSLIVKGDFVPYDQLVRYKWWFRQGYMSSTGQCFDIGAATRQSIEEFEKRQESFRDEHRMSAKEMDSLSEPELLHKFNVDCSKKNVAGNGSLMRLAPVPLFFHRYPEHAVKFSEISGRITHGDQRACDACRYYGALIVAALRGESKEELLAKDFYQKHDGWFNKRPLHPEILAIAEGSYKRSGYQPKYIHGKGFVVQSLEAALWAFFSDKNSFREGVLNAVNLGDDTDTTAAIYGQLAGAHYGYDKLPPEWREQVYAKKFLHCVCKWIVYKGCKWQPSHLQVFLPTNPARIMQILRTTNLPLAEQSNLSTKPKSACLAKSTITEWNIEVGPDFFLKGDWSRTPELYSTAKQTCEYDVAGHADERFPPEKRLIRSTSASAQSPSRKSQSKPNQDVDFAASVEYFLAKVSTPKDIGRWIQFLGKEFAVYGEIFEENNVDQYWFLNHLNHETLQQYGMQDRTHREKLLTQITRLRSQMDLEKFLATTKQNTSAN